MVDKEREYFIKYFSNTKYYVWSFKSCIDYRIEENINYTWYVTSNFSSNISKNIFLRNKLILNYLKNRIKNKYYIKLKDLVDILNSALSIAYWGSSNYYRIYFNINKNRKLGNLFNIDYKKNWIHTIWIDLNNFNIKVYEYINKISWKTKLPFNKIKSLWDVKFILKLSDIHSRVKYYFRFKGIKFINTWILEKFNIWQEYFKGKDIYINYIAYDLGKNKFQLYIVDKKSMLISNK